ncbi:MAG: FG-GAP repeat protein [Phycisphaerales bacterium]
MGYRVQFLKALLIAGIAVLATVDECLAQSACRDARLTASDPGVFESFGFAVAISDATAIVGAEWDRQLGTEAGAAYIFRPEGKMWTEMQKLLGSDQVAGDQFGHSVAIDGSVAMIGSLQHIHPDAPGTGAVYAFRFDSEASVWIEEEEVLTATGEWGDGFGEVVSLHDDLMLVGARFDDDNGANAGAAFVFRFDPDTSQWVEEQKLLASNGSGGDFFGSSVAVEGPLAVVGATNHQNNNNTGGAAYVFGFDPDTSVWVQEQILRPSDGAGGTNFGHSVSISGDLILVGAHVEGNNGAAYVFRLDPKASQWEMEQKFVASDPGGIDQFGRSVAIDGAPGNETAVVGAWQGNAFSGAAYIYRFDSDASQWIEQAIALPEPNAWTNFFGWSVAIDGETAVIGAHGEDQQRGAAYVFDVALNCDCPQDLDLDGSVGASDLLSLLVSWGPCKGCPADFDGNGTVGAFDLLALLVNWGPCP